LFEALFEETAAAAAGGTRPRRRSFFVVLIASVNRGVEHRSCGVYPKACSHSFNFGLFSLKPLEGLSVGSGCE